MTSPTDVTTAPAQAAPVVQTLTIGHGAVLRAIEKNTVTVVLPALGTLRLPPRETLAWFAGLATLTAVGLMEWPVAVAIGAGHLLAQQNHVRLLHDFGEALEEA
jgi:hypothetical protein